MFTFSSDPTTLEVLTAVPVPDTAHWVSQARHSRWRPIQHGALAQALLDEAEALGLCVERHSWQLSGSGSTELFGALDFLPTPSLGLPEGIGFSVGVRHSNAGRYALTLITGGRVEVCANGLFVGEQVLCRRHTEELELRATVRRGLVDALGQSGAVRHWVTRLKGVGVRGHQADRVMMEAARQGVLPWSAMQHVDRAWRQPPHAAFRPRTAWSLYNAFTEVARGRRPAGQLTALRGLRSLFAEQGLDGVLGRRRGSARRGVHE